MANIFVILTMGHIIFDWLLQNDWMAQGKSKRLCPLIVHSALYAMGTASVTYVIMFNLGMVTNASFWDTVYILFFTHVLLDNYKFHSWFKRYIKGMSEEADKNTLWLTICIDQCWHLLVLFYISIKLS